MLKIGKGMGFPGEPGRTDGGRIQAVTRGTKARGGQRGFRSQLNLQVPCGSYAPEIQARLFWLGTEGMLSSWFRVVGEVPRLHGALLAAEPRQNHVAPPNLSPLPGPP